MTFVLIDNSLLVPAEGPCFLYEEPERVISADDPAGVEAALQALETALADGWHAAGFFSYELGYLMEQRLQPLMPAGRKVPLLWFGIFKKRQALSNETAQAFLEARAGHAKTPVISSVSLDEAAYLQRFSEVERLISAGDIYQMNLTFKARFKLEGSALGLYLDLRKKQRVPHGAVILTPEFSVLSASPELFVKVEGRMIETRPMKGTAARAPTLALDETEKRTLQSDEKQRAENLMIVDLMRNDIGRIAEIGSVTVTDLYTVETYPTLHQLTSGVRAKLKPGVTLRDWLGATFPPGSITGAPKVRAMEIIRDLETEPRGVYCGAIGWLAPGGDACLNVAIRTVTVFPDGAAEIGVGSGLVADSVGPDEFSECLLKMRFLTNPVEPFDLFETMLFENGRFVLLERHLARLAGSAAYFGFRLDEATIRKALSPFKDGRHRVRLVLAEDGKVSVTSTPLPAAGLETMRFIISPTRMNPADPFLFHKTTRRAVYDGEWAEAKKTGADEVVYLNTSGEVTEGSRTNVFVRRDGKLLTPPLSAGLLPGTLRDELLETGEATEARLTLDDLSGDVLLGNSVRGLVPAKLYLP